MVRYMIYGTIFVADVTTRTMINDQPAETRLPVGSVATLLISAFALAGEGSADPFSPFNDTTIEAG